MTVDGLDLGPMAAAYSASGAAWQAGPARVYDRMAEALLGESPIELTGRLVVDVGAGTGAASRAIARAGGVPVACDLAEGMLKAAVIPPPRAGRVAADARALPLRRGSVGAVVAAFSLNHLFDPARALAEAGRVVEPGGAVLASAYALDNGHPVKQAVEQAAAEQGWEEPAWSTRQRAEAEPRLATVERAQRVAAASGLAASVTELDVALPQLGPEPLVAWRLGMAQMAPFVHHLTEARRRDLELRAVELLGDPPSLVRHMIVISAVI